MNKFNESLKKVYLKKSWKFYFNSINYFEFKISFQPSGFNFEKGQFGEITIKTNVNSDQSLFSDSLILNQNEQLNLIEMTNSKGCELVYRATRDGFTTDAFHLKCDDQANLVSIIRNNLNFVFGGYTSFAWNKYSGSIQDPNAFIFSLRRNGETKNDRFKAKGNGWGVFDGSEYRHLKYGSDIDIQDSSNKNVGSYCNFGTMYQLPDGITPKTKYSQSFLAGNYNQWLTTEIEVYEIKLD